MGISDSKANCHPLLLLSVSEVYYAGVTREHLLSQLQKVDIHILFGSAVAWFQPVKPWGTLLIATFFIIRPVHLDDEDVDWRRGSVLTDGRGLSKRCGTASVANWCTSLTS
jgi:hypothetical protein